MFLNLWFCRAPDGTALPAPHHVDGGFGMKPHFYPPVIEQNHVTLGFGRNPKGHTPPRTRPSLIRLEEAGAPPVTGPGRLSHPGETVRKLCLMSGMNTSRMRGCPLDPSTNGNKFSFHKSRPRMPLQRPFPRSQAFQNPMSPHFQKHTRHRRTQSLVLRGSVFSSHRGSLQRVSVQVDPVGGLQSPLGYRASV